MKENTNLIIKSDYKTNNIYPYKLMEDFYYYEFKVPKGFKTNFATLTPIGHLFIWKSAKLNEFATIHDYEFYFIFKNYKTLGIWWKFKQLLKANKRVVPLLHYADINKFQRGIVRAGIFFGAIIFGLIKPVFRKIKGK